MQKISDPSDLEQGLSQWNRKNKINVLAIRYYVILCTLLVHRVKLYYSKFHFYSVPATVCISFTEETLDFPSLLSKTL